MKLHQIAIGIIVISMMVLGALQFISELEEGYGETIDTTGLNKTLGRMKAQENVSEELREDIDDIILDDDSVSSFVIPYKLIQAGWGGFKLMFSSWFTMKTMVTETSAGIQTNAGVDFPSWLNAGIVAIIVILLVAMLLYAFFKWQVSI